MNVELNFLQGDKKSTKPMHMVLFIFLLLLFIASATYWFQHKNLTASINLIEPQLESKRELMAELHMSGENNPDVSDLDSESRGLHDLIKPLETIKDRALPHMELYTYIVGSLNSSEQIKTYDNASDGEYQLNANFGSLDDISSYMDKLLVAPYITNVSMGDVSRSDDNAYNTSLKIKVNIEALREELSGDVR